MEEITDFSVKDCLSLHGLGLQYFSSLRAEEDESIYACNDNYIRRFVHQAAYAGRVCALNQTYKSSSCDDILKIISEINVKGNVYDFIGG